MFAELREEAVFRGYETYRLRWSPAAFTLNAMRQFFERMGFRPLEIVMTLWDEQIPVSR